MNCFTSKSKTIKQDNILSKKDINQKMDVEEKKEEEINTKIKKKDKKIDDDEDIDNFQFKLNNEKELYKIELNKNTVVRLLDNNGKKSIDFAKFYKGYPTKKSIRIDYNTYLEINKLIEENAN